MVGLEFGQNFPGAVGRSVIDAYQFNFERHAEHTFDDLLQGGQLVVNGDHYGKFHGGGHGHSKGLGESSQGVRVSTASRVESGNPKSPTQKSNSNTKLTAKIAKKDRIRRKNDGQKRPSTTTLPT